MLLALITVVCGACGSSPSNPIAPTSSHSIAPALSNARTSGEGPQGEIRWEYTGETWQPSSPPPPCAAPLTLPTPVDVSKVTSILYPGQTRGGDYKPHGGFRFDSPNQGNDVPVSAPLDAVIIRGARYLVNGEIQYTFDFVNPCGIMYRLGHLRELSSRFQLLADTFPPASETDSRTTNVDPGQAVTSGEVVATAIGIRANGNVFVDWGVYDLRAPNASGRSGELEGFAVCWLDHLVPASAAIARALPPADPQSGKTSDYCR